MIVLNSLSMFDLIGLILGCFDVVLQVIKESEHNVFISCLFHIVMFMIVLTTHDSSQKSDAHAFLQFSLHFV